MSASASTSSAACPPLNMRVIAELRALADRRDAANARGMWVEVLAKQAGIDAVINVYASTPAERVALEQLVAPPAREPRRQRSRGGRATRPEFCAAPAGQAVTP